MNTFNVLLTLIECNVDECCCKHVYERDITVVSSNQIINLFNGYILNIVRVTDTYFTVLMQNGTQVVVRNVYTSFPTSLTLPDTNCCHTVTISGVVNSTT